MCRCVWHVEPSAFRFSSGESTRSSFGSSSPSSGDQLTPAFSSLTIVPNSPTAYPSISQSASQYTPSSPLPISKPLSSLSSSSCVHLMSLKKKGGLSPIGPMYVAS